MPKVHHVKRARKPIADHGINVGDSYYWWKFRYGGKHVSKTAPRPSQLTQSDFLSEILALEESIQDAIGNFESALEDMKSAIGEAADRVRDMASECEEKASNVEDRFPGGSPTIDLLNERASKCEEVADALESISLDDIDTSFVDELNGVDWSTE